MRTIEEKYQWLLSKLHLTDVNLWEHDALMTMNSLYVQFGDYHENMDEYVELVMNAEEGMK